MSDNCWDGEVSDGWADGCPWLDDAEPLFPAPARAPDVVIGHADRIDALVEVQRRRAMLDAEEQRLLAAIEADPTPALDRRLVAVEKHFVREEVACALRLSFATAAERMKIAHHLVHRLPDTLALMDRGAIGYLHARCLVESTHDLDDATTAKVQARVLDRAGAQTVAEFRRSLRRAVLALDPAGQADKHRRARKGRRVEHWIGEDGMASIFAELPAEDAAAITAIVDAEADRPTAPDDGRTKDQRRADALVDLICHDADADADADEGVDDSAGGSDTAAPAAATRRVAARDTRGTNRRRTTRRPLVNVTVALSTLCGLDDQPADLAGYGPIPAHIARRIAADTSGTWRRIVTDDVGRPIDYGRTRYTPPTDLAEYVAIRDQTCRMPGCNRTACRCELDHRIAWADDGTTCEANLQALCCRHHHIKHDAGWTMTKTENGTTVWTTPTGHQYEKLPPELPIDQTIDDV